MTASFTELGLSQELLKAVEDLGFEEPSPIQVLAIPALLTGKDAVGQAQTGTGKTAAFGLPILEKINLKKIIPQAMIVTMESSVKRAKASVGFLCVVTVGLPVVALSGLKNLEGSSLFPQDTENPMSYSSSRHSKSEQLPSRTS